MLSTQLEAPAGHCEASVLHRALHEPRLLASYKGFYTLTDQKRFCAQHTDRHRVQGAIVSLLTDIERNRNAPAGLPTPGFYFTATWCRELSPPLSLSPGGRRSGTGTHCRSRPRARTADHLPPSMAPFAAKRPLIVLALVRTGRICA